MIGGAFSNYCKMALVETHGAQTFEAHTKLMEEHFLPSVDDLFLSQSYTSRKMPSYMLETLEGTVRNAWGATYGLVAGLLGSQPHQNSSGDPG